MLYSEIIAVGSQIHAKHTNAMCNLLNEATWWYIQKPLALKI